MSFMSRPRYQPMDNATLAQLSPSVFACTAHESRSDRYTLIPTSRVVDALRDHGFAPVHATEARSRDHSKRGFAKHLIRFRHESAPARALNETIPEVVLTNSHDGSSAYALYGGLFRLICLNGMVVPDGFCGSVKVPHKGDVVRQVIEGSYEVIEGANRTMSVVKDWSAIDLSRDEQMALAESAHRLRFADTEGKVTTPIQPEALLTPRRYADNGSDLWRSWNRIQENAIKGGLSAWGISAPNGRVRRVTSKAVTGIEGSVRLNRELFALGARMAELKGAPVAA
jgi:hypothetical protein